jgi:Mg-chelatase subunit ChlD
MWRTLFVKKNTRTIGILAFLALAALIPVTVFLSNQIQETRQQAATVCTQNQALDVIIVYDRSGSMKDPTSATDPTTRMVNAQNASKTFVDLLAAQTTNPPHKLGLVAFADEETSELALPLTQTFSTPAKTAIDGMTIESQTCIECAAKLANDEFSSRGRSNVKKVAILVTDGGSTRYLNDGIPPDGNGTTQTIIEAERRALAEIKKGHEEQGIVYYTIGFGTPGTANRDLKEQFLKDAASETGGKYIYVPTAGQLQAAFTELSQIIGKGAIEGFKFNDANKNGQFGTGEEKLGGWRIDLLSTTDALLDSKTTSTSGQYRFEGLCDGSYKVREEVKPGWEKIFPAAATHNVTIAAGEIKSDINFGNAIAPTTVTPSASPSPSPSPTATPTLPPSPTPNPLACPANATLDVMMLFDRSGSMKDPTSSTDPTTRMVNAQKAAKKFVDIIDADNVTPVHHLGLVAFADEETTELSSQLTPNFAPIKTAIDAMTIESQTCIECAAKKANDEFKARGRSNIKKVAVLVTDGGATRYINDGIAPGENGTTQTIIEAERRALAEIKKGYNEQGIVYYTIGFGVPGTSNTSLKEQFLKDVAKETGGKYIYVPTAADLEEAFEELSLVIARGSIAGFKYDDDNGNGQFDTNEDKLPGWTIQLKNNTNQLLNTTMTDSEGNYIFKDLCDGTYNLSEIQKQDWIKTSPTTASITVNLQNGALVTGISFGNKAVPTHTPTPTPTTGPTEIRFGLKLILDGIGIGGDTQNISENVFSNKNPLTRTRQVKVELLNDTAILAEASGNVTYDTASQTFIGTASASTTVPSGQYFIRVKSPGYLSKKLPAKIVVTRNTTNIIPTINMVTGDTNRDNKLDVLDYNNILTCHTGLRGRPASCTNETHAVADINDDGKVNEVDYNLFIRELPAEAGT